MKRRTPRAALLYVAVVVAFSWACGVAACSRTELLEGEPVPAALDGSCSTGAGCVDVGDASLTGDGHGVSADASRREGGPVDGAAEAGPPASFAPAYLVDPEHDDTMTGTAVKPPLERAWTQTFAEAVSYPLLVDGVVYVTTNGIDDGPGLADAFLYAVDAHSGSILWKKDLGLIESATIAYDGGRLFAMENAPQTYPAYLHAFDASTGEAMWSAIVQSEYFFDAPPVAYRGVVYVLGDGEGTFLYAFDEATGSLDWQQQTVGGEGSPAVSDDGVFVTDGCANVDAFDRTTGASLWQQRGGCEGGGALTAVLSGHALYETSILPGRGTGGAIFDVTSDAPLGSYVSEIPPSFGYGRGFTLSDGTITAYDPMLDTSLWSFSGDGRLATSPLVADGFVYEGSTTGNLYAIDAATGAGLWFENTGYPLESQEVLGMAPRVNMVAGDGLLIVPAGPTLLGYVSAPADAGAMDAGCAYGLTLVSPSPVTGEIPAGESLADLNGDGRLDLVLAESYLGYVSVLLGHGDGTFGADTEFAAGVGADFVATADFNQDGRQDVAVTNTYSGSNETPATVSILLGNGDGTLQPQVTYATSRYPGDLVAADLNGDGFVDLVVSGDEISILFGRGDGTFEPYVSVVVPGGAFSLSVVDVNADGNLDVLAVDGMDDVAVFLGRGDGTFATPVGYPVGDLPEGLAVGDVNGDGRLDLAVTNLHGNDVGILLGHGDGTFGPATTFATGLEPDGVLIADLDLDGNADLAVANSSASTVSILLGRGDGTFQQQFVEDTGNAPSLIETADLNGDHVPDLVVVDSGSNSVSVFFGSCAGSH